MHIHMSPERMLQRIDSDKLMTFTTTLMTGLSGAMASVVLLVMTVVFMLLKSGMCPINSVLPSTTRKSTSPVFIGR